MIFKVYGSGSSGNSYALIDNNGNALILDAGISAKSIFRDIKPSQIKGVLVTHEHGDHAKYAPEYNAKYIKVLLPDSLGGEVSDGKIIQLGDFSIIALSMFHDVPCYGYAIMHRELTASVLYATDTNGIPYEFEELSLAIIEANYKQSILDYNLTHNIIDAHRAKRTATTHNSLAQAIDFICNRVQSKVEHIVLAHLSSDNASGESFKQEMIKASGVPTDIAYVGLTYEFMIKRNEDNER